MRKYFYTKLREYLDLYIRPADRVFEIDVKGTAERLKFDNHLVHSAAAVAEGRRDFTASGGIPARLRAAQWQHSL